ncbi:MAG: Tryptophan synthase alpha chain [Labilithrix sp.]|nr:Tryptophan synthase alpha chain [Labilithrix sp.]
MKNLNRFKAPLAVVAALALPVLSNGCSSSDGGIGNPLGDICCTDFKVGADLSGVNFGVDASIKGQFSVLAQAGSDFSGVASAMIDDVTSACMGIATDLGVSDADRTAAEGITNPTDRVKKWCELAVGQIKAQGVASGTLDITPPSFKCEASVEAKGSCQAKCSVDGKCDIKATPPKCTGGTLVVQCSGSCDGSVDPGGIDCKGSCTATASGKCTATGGVECQGRCEGTCEGTTDSGGNCQGNCKGSCSATKPGVACNGSFEGKCTGSCAATGPSAKVECSGGCSADATPLKCTGGKMEGGCQVDAKCDANCDASVNAKASCDVEPFSITAKGNANANVEAVIATLRVNLPKLLLAVKARGEAITSIAGNFSGKGTVDVIADPGKLGVKGTACAVAIVSALGAGAQNAAASIEAGLTVTGQVGL